VTKRAPTLSFQGGTGTVTGSRFLLETAHAKVLVDAGLFQGPKDLRLRNWEPFPVDPATIDAVVVTHAHLDHSGYLPVLARDGFEGPIVCSEETAKLLRIVILDAAHLQEQEAEWARDSRVSKHADPRPLFDTADAERALGLLRPVAGSDPVEAGPASVVLRRAGHVLGSRFAEVNVDGRTTAFSGDLGRPDHPLLEPPEPLRPVDHVVVESTYGDRVHAALGKDELADVLTRTVQRGGTALVPAFAVDRTPLLLHVLRELVEAGRVPDVPVYVDSPMALAALDVYRGALGPGGDFRDSVVRDPNPFDPGKLRLVRDPGESARLNDARHPCILISASGMAEGGRVLHHLEHQLPNRRNAVVLTGYQVAGTRGRQLADGATQVKIHGKYVRVRAEVANVRGFSAHADSGQVLDWLAGADGCECVYVVHGEVHAAEALADRVRARMDCNAVVARHEERVRID
jgi:metallo-beta-lactamase family protein